jgi:hypothetical protein
VSRGGRREERERERKREEQAMSPHEQNTIDFGLINNLARLAIFTVVSIYSHHLWICLGLEE